MTKYKYCQLFLSIILAGSLSFAMDGPPLEDHRAVDPSEQTLIAALKYFERYHPQFDVDKTSLQNLIDAIETKRSQWELDFDHEIEVVGALVGTVKSNCKKSSDEQVQSYVVEMQKIAGHLFLRFPDDKIGEGTFTKFAKRTRYPQFTAMAYGTPQEPSDYVSKENLERAFAIQFNIFNHLIESGDQEIWQYIMRPFLLGKNFVVFPLMVSDLYDAILSYERKVEDSFTNVDILKFMRTVALALQHLGKYGISHNDVKPENIFIARGDDGNWQCRLADFNSSNFTKNEFLYGNHPYNQGAKQYCAPEFLADYWQDSDVDIDTKVDWASRKDVFGLGVALHYLVKDRFPNFVPEEKLYDEDHIMQMSVCLDVYLRDTWKYYELQLIDYLYLTMFRSDPSQRISAEKVVLALDYLILRKSENNQVKNARRVDEKVDDTNFQFRIFELDEDQADDLLNNLAPCTFIVRRDPSEDGSLKLSFVLPFGEQQLTDMTTHHVSLARVSTPEQLNAVLMYFKNLGLIEIEYAP